MSIMKTTTKSKSKIGANDILNGLKRRPTHPGEILREDVLPALKVTQEEFANALGVSRQTVSDILHERRPITVDMALLIGTVIGNGPGLWLRMQQQIDVWDALEKNRTEYEGLTKIIKVG